MSRTWWVSDSDLDTDQALAVQGMSEDASFLVRGPAGSGKTNILLLRAKWFQLMGKSHYQIVVFTRTLRDFIRGGCNEYGIAPEAVVTSVQFFLKLLDEYGVSTDKSGNFETDRTLLAGKVQALIESHPLNDFYDALLVDECQDYSDTELAIFRSLTDRLILAVDSRQSIYRTTQPAGLLEELVGRKVVDLKYHYRSGLKLCRVADAVLRDSAHFAPVQNECLYDEKAKPSSVDVVPCASLEAQYKEILERLPAQLDAYPEELIGVLFPKREQAAGFVDELSRKELSKEASRIRVDTMHAGKGLEFRAVHLGGCEALYRMGPVQKRLIYTSILRGQTAVLIYYTGNVPGYVESAVAQLSPPKRTPGLKDLFKHQ